MGSMRVRHGARIGWRGRRGIFALRKMIRAPTVGIGEDTVAMHRHRPSFATTWASTGRANGRITTRRAASLCPPRNGRIGFKPPYSKRERGERPEGAIVYRGHFLRVERFNHAIQSLEDRSDAAFL